VTPPALLSLADVRRICGGLSGSSIRRLTARGAFPSAIALATRADGSPARVAWVEAEVRAWVSARIAAARAESAR
jgi:predicted DNA-binding transcriptional regulator AlpA